MKRALALCGLVAALTVGSACSSTKPKQQTPDAVPTSTSIPSPTYTPTPVDVVPDATAAATAFAVLLSNKGVVWTPTPQNMQLCDGQGNCPVISNVYVVSLNDLGTPYPTSPPKVGYVVGDLPSAQATAVAFNNSIPSGFKLFAIPSSTWAGLQATSADYWTNVNAAELTWEGISGGYRIVRYP